MRHYLYSTMINLKLLSTPPTNEREKKQAAALFLMVMLICLKGIVHSVDLLVSHPSPVLYKILAKYLALALTSAGLVVCIYRMYSYRLWSHLLRPLS